jgi:dihydroxy-acid dehydratase
MIGHVAPEAALGGPIAVIREGGSVTSDVDRKRLDLDVPADELHARFRTWQPPAPRYAGGVMAKYAALVSSASHGAVTTGQALADQLAARARAGAAAAAAESDGRRPELIGQG